MITTNDPVWIAVTFSECPCEYHATLRVSANNDSSLLISVVHNHIRLYDIAGNGTISDLQVADGDTLLVVAYNADRKVVACGEFHVQMDLIGKLSVILNPRLATNLIVDQHSQRLIDRAGRRALDAACDVSSVSTGELVVAEVR